MAPTPGILYVTMQPRPGLPPAQFHDWYNNEHGPLRLRLPFIENGFRYRATDLDGAEGSKDEPEWMAIYDISDTARLTEEVYTSLRTDAVKTQREKDVMGQIVVDRKIFDLVETREADGFRRLEELGLGDEGKENVLVALSGILIPGKKTEAVDRWFDKEYIPRVSKVPGFRRIRRFMTSPVQGADETEYLTLLDFAPQTGLAGTLQDLLQEGTKRTYDLSSVFGAAPRDLSSVGSADAKDFTSRDGRTKTLSAFTTGTGPAIESWITTKDGVDLEYRLEGSSDPNAPLIVLSNSILVDWGIWSAFVASFLSIPQSEKYRILRYHTRGRTSKSGNRPITVDVLAEDVMDLLDALRVPRAAALIGVSLGGATVLNAALKYPERVAAFISCDTNAKSPEGNRKAWGDRIVVAQKQGAKSDSGDSIVGSELAEMTVNRWFVQREQADSTGATRKEPERSQVKSMAEKNSLDGFIRSVGALYDYDLRDEMKTSSTKSAFFVGSGDGALPAAMKDMAASYGSASGTGGKYAVIEGAGHLPMVEQPEQFADKASSFLTALSGTSKTGPGEVPMLG